MRVRWERMQSWSHGHWQTNASMRHAVLWCLYKQYITSHRQVAPVYDFSQWLSTTVHRDCLQKCRRQIFASVEALARGVQDRTERPGVELFFQLGQNPSPHLPNIVCFDHVYIFFKEQWSSKICLTLRLLNQPLIQRVCICIESTRLRSHDLSHMDKPNRDN